jgi:hypothetical protein
MPTMPSREALRREFDAAILEIDRSRKKQKLTTDFYSRIGDSVFEAGCIALMDTCDPQVVPRLHVVSAPVGSGKTSFSEAFIAAVVRLGEKDDTAPFGCVFVADQITRADTMFKALNERLPGKVAIWTSAHANKKRTTKVLTAAATPKDDLRNYPVVVCTHAFFGGKESRKAKMVMHHGRLGPRALSVVDERIEGEVEIFDVAYSAAERVRELVQQDARHVETIGPHMDALVKFMFARSFGGRDLEKPTDDQAAWAASSDLQWFATVEASAFVRANQDDPDVYHTFGFAKALTNGYAFIARDSGDGNGTHYIGYESNLVVAPGMMLLDATADIDGVSLLCPERRKHANVPKAKYDNLTVIHVPSCTKARLNNFLKTLANRRTYVAWMIETIKTHMAPNQKGLVVCRKSLFDNENVPNHPIGYQWDIDGRKLCATYWGTGVGDNIWQDADVVFLFVEFFLPNRTVIAKAQGLQQHKATEGALGSMRSLRSPAPAVVALREGHLLRWLKQMALRGKARDYDEHGVCGLQKLVCSADHKRLVANQDQLFPGAKFEKSYVGSSEQTQARALLAILSDTSLPEKITTKWIGQQMHKPWRTVSKNIMKLGDVKRAIANLGWEYVQGLGCKGSSFTRLKSTTVLGGPNVPVGTFVATAATVASSASVAF